MKKYSFRLQTVLEIREKKLEEKRREMAVVVEKLNEQNHVRENLISKQSTIKNYLETIYTDGRELDICEVTNYKDYLVKVIVATRNQDAVIEKTQHLLRFKQLEVSEALKEVKILEKLKETQQTKFYKEYEYLQAKEIDDISSTRYKRAVA